MEKFDCGCAITMRGAEVRRVDFCEKHDSLYSEHKSPKQMSLDLDHQLRVERYAPHKEPAVEEESTK